MKQLLFLFLLPCLAWAQYPGNGNQKITLGEQTTADGLIWRGVASIDTVTATSKITRTNKQDTSAFLLLDTTTNLLWHYKTASNGWSQAGGLTLDTATMLLPYYRSGRALGTPTSGVLTNATGLPISSGLTGLGAANRIPYASSTTALTTSSNFTFNGNNFIISNNKSFTGNESFFDNEINSTYTGTTNQNSLVVGALSTSLTYAGTSSFANSRGINALSNITNTGTNNNISAAYYSMRTSSNGAANNLNCLESELVKSGTGNVTNAKGNIISIYNDGSGTITNNYALFINDLVNSAGTMTNTYGIYIGDLTIGTQTTKAYSLYISDENTRSYLNGSFGYGVLNPTARLHIAAGTATANTAPLKFTSGTNLTTAEAGAMEFNGTNLCFSPSTTRHTVNHGLTGSATLDFPSTLTLLSADLTITVTGAADGDVVSLGVPNAAVNANTSYSAWVSASNTVTVRFNNYSSGTVNPASGSFKVFVTK